ncbi:hypothetical protein [Longibaculum muris]|uniref:hypothetical protein n=1 Tax=Longibaculum muris TaxID=1796628 RepID=UPI0022E47107|nr:hypothetical protein [Longibaculum muris]
MNHQKNSVIDMTFLISSLFCCLHVYQLFKARFLSVLFIIPLIGFGYYLYKYIQCRNREQAWDDIKKNLLIFGIICIILSGISKYTLDTIEFLSGAYGYTKTVVLNISDYTKIDYSKNIDKPHIKSMMIANRNLYIVKTTNENKVLKIIDEIVDFKEKPKLGYNTYTVKSYKYGDIWFKIHYKNHYCLVEIHV